MLVSLTGNVGDVWISVSLFLFCIQTMLMRSFQNLSWNDTFYGALPPYIGRCITSKWYLIKAQFQSFRLSSTNNAISWVSLNGTVFPGCSQRVQFTHLRTKFIFSTVERTIPKGIVATNLAWKPCTRYAKRNLYKGTRTCEQQTQLVQENLLQAT